MKSDSQLKPGHLRYYEAVLYSYLLRLASWTGRGSTASSLPGGSGRPGSPLVLQPVDSKEGSPVTAGQEWEVQLPCDLLMLPHGRIPTWLPLPPSPPLRLCPHGWRWVTVSSVLRSRGRMVIVSKFSVLLGPFASCLARESRLLLGLLKEICIIGISALSLGSTRQNEAPRDSPAWCSSGAKVPQQSACRSPHFWVVLC